MSLFAELKRRNVFKVGIAYVVASWLLLQLTEVLTELLEIGPEVGKIVIVLLIVGFLPALIFAWAFELTPEGIKREHEVDRSQSIAPNTGRKLDFWIIGLLVIALGYFVWESRFAERGAVESTAERLAIEQTAAAPESVAAEPVATVPPADDHLSIVVLPFVNMSNDPDQEFFSDGLSEEILNALVKIKDLRVISRTSAFAFKGKDFSIPDIAARLDVSHVLEGSVRKAGDQVRITAQLIEVETDSHLWSDAYNRDLENVFEIQEEISLAIANELQVTLGADQSSARPTASLEAYQLFLRGRHHYQERGQENLTMARRLLEQAVELDPDYAEAWANLGAAATVEGYYVDEGFETLHELAITAARKAIAINPGSGFAHAVLGLQAFGDQEFEGAVDALQRAIELNPNESNSHLWLAISLSGLGYTERAIEALKTAEQFDPVFSNLQNWLVNLYLNQGDLDAARKHRDRLAALDPAFSLNNAGLIELMEGDIDAAEAEALEDSADNQQLLPIIESYYAALRNPEHRDQSVASILELEKESRFTTLFPWLYSLGAVDEATAAWHRQIAQGRGLRASNALDSLWAVNNRDKLSHLATKEFFEATGLADYWRNHGDPDYCRVNGREIQCDSD